jgi:hypothetical protein
MIICHHQELIACVLLLIKLEKSEVKSEEKEEKHDSLRIDTDLHSLTPHSVTPPSKSATLTPPENRIMNFKNLDKKKGNISPYDTSPTDLRKLRLNNIMKEKEKVYLPPINILKAMELPGIVIQ